MGGGHHHGHDHDHGSAEYNRAFLIGIVLNTVFVTVEAGYGFAANSMALLADAGHNLGDVLGLAVAWIGARLVQRRASPRFTYGLKKSSILAALVNALLLLVAVGGIGAEAIRRLLNPEGSDGQVMMAVAAVGIVINAATALLFARGRKDDINIRGAYLHMLADAAVSAGVVFAGALILWTGARWIDPATSLIVATIILLGTWGLLVDSTSMTLAGTPRGIDPRAVGAALEQLPGVTGTHHLHIWPLSTTETAMTVHLVVDDNVDRDRILIEASDAVHDRFGIAHSTIQVERTADHGDDCETC
ncbi:cation transporter [Sphingomonas sp. HDW15A]|uniref:cation diffusion facilitator family transporter n=1 Tax=Sphingomonas sp. HDW15A TaxID=2714942 RepID=UPI00140A65EF|nr:cation diffusion facilitator family transporter [Sphingomonas sp. HDW15A]QIK95343.1 cation transporter [Sphingomonas sp. HDW15A]